MYYTYMLRCNDNSIYTGITTDLSRRFLEHTSQDTKCAKYTLSHKALRIEAAWQTSNRALASKLEYHLKHLTKTQKEQLIKSCLLQDFLSNKIDNLDE